VGYLGICPFYLYDPGRGDLDVMKKAMRGKHTCYCARLFGILAANEENDIPLAGVDIVVFQEKDLVYAIFLKGAELDEQANGTGQRLLNDQILLASDLKDISLSGLQRGSTGSLTYTFQQVEQISPSLVCYFLGVDCPDG
jgi:hypothetical protein